MRLRALAALILLLTVGMGACEPEPPAPPEEHDSYTYSVINTFPHDVQAFTQGLVYTSDGLYEGTGLHGQSSLRRVDLDTGAVLQQISLSSAYFGEGITVFGDRIFQLTWQNETGFIYDREDLTQTGTFSYPGEGWGLTHDGEQLIMSDGTSWLRFLNPDTLTETGRVQVLSNGVAVDQLNELEYIDGQVYANVWRSNFIVIIEPATGEVVSWIDLAGLLPDEDRTLQTDVLNGIAYDAEANRLFVTGKRWPKLFEIELVPNDVR